MRKSNSIIVLLFIPNNFQYKYKLKHAYLYRFFNSSSIVCLSVSLGSKRLFSTANILQIAEVVRHTWSFLLVVLAMFQAIVRLFRPRETSEMFCHFVLTTKNSSNLVPRSSWSNVQFSGNYAAQTHRKIPPNLFAGYGEIRVGCDFSKSETEKYFK